VVAKATNLTQYEGRKERRKEGKKEGMNNLIYIYIYIAYIDLHPSFLPPL
jgi:hypothetical protein